MTDNLAIQLKDARTNTGFSQNDVATILHISRQSVSKWERGVTYPDLDNLIRLSDIYKVSIDELVKKNAELKSQIDDNNQKIRDKRKQLKEVNTKLYQNSNEGIILLILAIVSTLIPPLGLFIPGYTIWRNTKYNILYKTIIVVSVIAILISILNCYVIITDNWIKPANTTVYNIK